MKSAILLLFQLALAVGIFVVSPNFFGILQENPQSWLKFYQQTAELFAVPFCLLLFSFSKRPLFLGLRLVWGGWTATTSTGLLWNAPVQFTDITEFGRILIAFNSIFGFAVALFALIEISKKWPVTKPAFTPDSTPGSQSGGPAIEMVEGA
ncbi:MAG: hypothetical protein EBQ92_06485 [Proteobacteria bacterium]|nr:hypothetical protein [Pseudomonadota bacterium]